MDATPTAEAAHGHDAAHGDHAEHDHHVCSAETFVGIIAALFVLTWLTVYVSNFDFGSANMLIAMAIASVKATLVVAVFMHVLWDTTINRLMFLCSFLFLGLLFLFTFADLLARHTLVPEHGKAAPLPSHEMPELSKPGTSEKRFFDLKQGAQSKK